MGLVPSMQTHVLLAEHSVVIVPMKEKSSVFEYINKSYEFTVYSVF